MPCDSISRKERERLVRELALEALEDALKEKSARIARVGNTISIEGWDHRGSWCDECAIRRLKQSEDFEVRTMIATAIPEKTGITFGHEH